jgi:hypothetical protein
MEAPVTMVRLYLPEASHSTHKAQMEKVMHLLCDQLHVHGLSVSSGLREAGTARGQRYETVSDVLKRKLDPPTIIEFFDESPAATQIKRKLCELAPNSYAVSWQANWETAASQRGDLRAARSGGA